MKLKISNVKINVKPNGKVAFIYNTEEDNIKIKNDLQTKCKDITVNDVDKLNPWTKVLSIFDSNIKEDIEKLIKEHTLW